MTAMFFSIATLIGLFVNACAVIALGYQQITISLDGAHKALLAVNAFSLIFFAAILIVH